MMYSLVPDVEQDGVEAAAVSAEKLETDSIHVTPIPYIPSPRPPTTVPAEEKVPSHLHQELVLGTVEGGTYQSSEVISKLRAWEKPKCGLILFEGAPGIGKSTFAHELSRQFCSISVDLEKYKNMAEFKVQLKDADSCLIILDGFDYLVAKRQKSLKGFCSVLKSKVSDGMVLITTRPIGVEHLYRNFEVEQHYCIDGFSPADYHDYFRSIEPGKYSLICALLNQHEKCLQGLCCNPWVCSKLVGILQSKKIHALNLTVTKIVYEIVLGIISREFQRDGVSPVTSLYSLSAEHSKQFDILCKLALADLVNGSSLESLDSYCSFLSSFSLENSIASLDEVTTLGLLSHCSFNSHYASIKGRLYWFLSFEIRDFLAAFALHLLPPLDLLYLLSEHAQSLLKNKAYHGWLEFFYGLTVQRIEAQNPIHMMIATLNDLLVYSLDLEESGQMMVFIGCLWETEQPTLWKKLASKSCSFLRMSFLEEEVGKITPGLVNLITFSGFESWVIELGKGSEAGVNLMAYVATVDIEVKEDPSLEGVVRIWPKGLKTPKSRSSEQATDFSVTIEQKLSKIGVFFCRAIREILQRVLQLYTSLKLKGDCSSLSFVSFLSCECFQKAVDGRITFEPIVPSHFLTIESASSKVGRKGGELIQHFREIHNDEAIELVILLRPCLKMVRFLLPSSQDNVLEIRLSGSYMPDNIYELFTSTFLLELEEVVHCAVAQESFPMKTEKVLPKLPECTAGTVSPAISLPPANPTPAGETEEDPSSLLSPPPTSSDPPPPTKTEEQLSPATLPPSSNLLPPIAMEPTTIEGQGPQDTYADSAFESTGGPLHQPVSSIPSLQPSNLPPIVTVDENTSATPKGHSSSSHKTDNSTASTVGPLHQRPSIHNFSLQASSEPKLSTSLGVKLPHIQSRPASHLSSLQFPLVQPIQQSGRKLTSLRAGTVLYSNEPLIPTNHVIELPKEDNLIQSGGNGQIFAGIIAGLDVAVKKTSYRSKEYGIVTLIKHKNIVPLLAFVWGEENPAHRRRYFCYHVMARVTGKAVCMYN